MTVETVPGSKEVVVAGCKVTLDFRRTESTQWTVAGTVWCGLGENRRATVFHTAPCRTQEEAEQRALKNAGDLIGKNTPTGEEDAHEPSEPK